MILSCEIRTQRAIVSKDCFHIMPSSDLTPYLTLSSQFSSETKHVSIALSARTSHNFLRRTNIYILNTMKLTLTPTFLLVLNLSAAVASHQHLRARHLTNTTDTTNSTVSPTPAPTTTNSTTLTLAPTTNSTTNSTTLSPAPTTSEPTAAPTNEPSAAPTRELTAAPTIWTCPEDVLVPIGTWDDYWWRELPSCVQDAGELLDYRCS